MVMLDWNHKMKEVGTKAKVWVVAAAFLITNLGGIQEKIATMGAGHPSIGGRMIRGVLEGERDGDVGKVVGRDEAGKDKLIPF